MSTLWNREPAVIIGFVVSVIVLIAQQAIAQGIVTSSSSVNWLNLVISVTPLIGGLLTRGQVTPAP